MVWRKWNKSMSELYDRWHSIRLVLAICGVLVIAVIGREIIADVNRNGVVLAMTAAKKLVAMAVILIGYGWGVNEWIAGGRKGNLRWGGWQRVVDLLFRERSVWLQPLHSPLRTYEGGRQWCLFGHLCFLCVVWVKWYGVYVSAVMGRISIIAGELRSWRNTVQRCRSRRAPR